MRKRTNIIWVGILILMLALGARLFYIQVISGEQIAKETMVQQLMPVNGLNLRGQILDRNMNPLTGSELKYYYVIDKLDIDDGAMSIVEMNQGKEVGGNSKYKVFQFDTLDVAVNEKLKDDYNAYAFQYSGRYSENQLCAHLVGSVNQWNMEGISGVEKMCNSTLSVTQSQRPSLLADGAGNIIMGRGLITTENIEKKNVVTTIDISLQEKVEEILGDVENPSAVVVLEVETGQVLAMASTPTYDPNHLEDYVNQQGDQLINKVVQGQYSPGSVFKLVVAAAALEQDKSMAEDHFVCTGRTTVNGVSLGCTEGPAGGHGDITMKEAIAKSCNCYFAHLGAKIGSESIIQMATKLGFGEKTIGGLAEEEKGNFPDEESREYSGISNLSIGQGSLLVTPIQVAKMTNIIANNGVDSGISIIKSEEEEEIPIPETALSEETCQILKFMMEEVMAQGTGSKAVTKISCSGKTGSAEATSNGEKVVHGWFTGYFPSDNPKYTVTVFVENGKTGSGSALPVFTELVNYLY